MSSTSVRGPLKVIYVMGAGHSGSTILGIALGNCTDVFYAGEVEEWLVAAGVAGWSNPERARLWGSVRDEMDGAAADLMGGEVNRCVERSSAVLRIDRWPARRRILHRYRRAAEDLLAAISRASGASCIVDTSHFPLRARELRRLEGIELFLVFLAREPQGVVESNVRMISRHEVAERRLRILALNVDLWLTQLVSIFVFLRHPRKRRMFLWHEDFVADPEGVLRAILDMAGSSAAMPDLAALSVGAPLQGNRLIKSQTIALKRTPDRPVRSSRLTSVLQMLWAPLLRRLRPAAKARPSREHVSPPERQRISV